MGTMTEVDEQGHVTFWLYTEWPRVGTVDYVVWDVTGAEVARHGLPYPVHTSRGA